MVRFWKAGIAFCALSFPVVSQAGIPVAAELICPIGGEKFEITETSSCSSFGERTMSFAPVSSCDFITRLPQCPANFLPMYKEFSEDDLGLLRDFMQTESYDSAVDQSRFYLAFITEQYLSSESGRGFGLLLSGLWFDPANTYSDPLYLDAFFYEATSELNAAPAEDLPYLQAIIAFARVKAGQLQQAQDLLDASAGANISEGLLPDYIAAIQSCINDENSANCDPQTLISTN